MPTTQTTKTKQKTKVVEKKQTEEVEEQENEALPAKTKKIVEIDEPERIIVGVEEKLDDDAVQVPEDEEGGGVEDATLDDEEVDPFGDKYEI